MKDTKNRLIQITARLIAVALMVTAIVPVGSISVYASTTRIAQATNGEGGKLSGCRAGDQSGNEVSISKWTYGSSGPFHWEYVFRAKDNKIAKQLAKNMIAAANNNNIGYDQDSPDRNSFFDAAQANDWDIETISRSCETTCSSAISVCLNAAGVDVPRTWSAGEMHDDIMKTDMFECYTSKAYTASSANLLPGDILVSPRHHAAMVVESPNKFTYDIYYCDNKGKDQQVSVEEGTTISLNLNNGDKTQTVTVEDSLDLKNYAPEKQGAVFKGWKSEDDGLFTAKYTSKTKALITSNTKKDLE